MYHLVVSPPNRDAFVDGRSFNLYFTAWIACMQYHFAWPGAQVTIKAE